MDYTATPYEIINSGNNHTVSLMEMIRALEEVLGIEAKLEFSLHSREVCSRPGRMWRKQDGPLATSLQQALENYYIPLRSC